MDSLLELAPVVAFFGTYYFTKDIYTATTVLMVAMALLLAVDYLRTRRIPTLHLVSAVLVFAFGAATLLLHSKKFIQWKPTAFFWLLAVAFLLSNWIGKQPLVQRMLAKSLGTEIQVSPATWRRLNWLSVVFYVAIGALNLFVAFNASESAWVNFKMFGLTGATFVFLALQIGWLMRRAGAEPSAQA